MIPSKTWVIRWWNRARMCIRTWGSANIMDEQPSARSCLYWGTYLGLIWHLGSNMRYIRWVKFVSLNTSSITAIQITNSIQKWWRILNNIKTILLILTWAGFTSLPWENMYCPCGLQSNGTWANLSALSRLYPPKIEIMLRIYAAGDLAARPKPLQILSREKHHKCLGEKHEKLILSSDRNSQRVGQIGWPRPSRQSIHETIEADSFPTESWHADRSHMGWQECLCDRLSMQLAQTSKCLIELVAVRSLTGGCSNEKSCGDSNWQLQSRSETSEANIRLQKHNPRTNNWSRRGLRRVMIGILCC